MKLPPKNPLTNGGGCDTIALRKGKEKWTKEKS